MLQNGALVGVAVRTCGVHAHANCDVCFAQTADQAFAAMGIAPRQIIQPVATQYVMCLRTCRQFSRWIRRSSCLFQLELHGAMHAEHRQCLAGSLSCETRRGCARVPTAYLAHERANSDNPEHHASVEHDFGCHG